MLSYNDLRPEDDFKKRDYELIFPQMSKAEKIRTTQNLLELKKGLDKSIAPRRTNENLIGSSDESVGKFDHRLCFLYQLPLLG